MKHFKGNHEGCSVNGASVVVKAKTQKAAASALNMTSYKFKKQFDEFEGVELNLHPDKLYIEVEGEVLVSGLKASWWESDKYRTLSEGLWGWDASKVIGSLTEEERGVLADVGATHFQIGYPYAGKNRWSDIPKVIFGCLRGDDFEILAELGSFLSKDSFRLTVLNYQSEFDAQVYYYFDPVQFDSGFLPDHNPIKKPLEWVVVEGCYAALVESGTDYVIGAANCHAFIEKTPRVRFSEDLWVCGPKGTGCSGDESAEKLEAYGFNKASRDWVERLMELRR